MQRNEFQDDMIFTQPNMEVIYHWHWKAHTVTHTYFLYGYICRQFKSINLDAFSLFTY